jgi:hypothetical protein
MFQVFGEIDIAPPLTWSEVEPSGFAVMNAKGVPKPPAGQFVELIPVEDIVARPEGTLHRFTFSKVVAAGNEVPEDQREAFRAQVAAVIAAFPTHVFGAVSRVIRFRGDLLDDQWRVRLDPDGTVRYQKADLSWIDP